MNTLITLLQIAVIALCVWGELGRRFRRGLLVSIALGCIAMSSLIGLGRYESDIASALLWLAVLILVGAVLRWLHILHCIPRRHPWLS